MYISLEIIETKFKEPNETEIDSIYNTTTVVDDSKCNDLNQWTSWRSIDNPAENDGNDYETLYSHREVFV